MPPVKCEQCGREFGSEHGLKIHVGRRHSGKAKAKRGRKKAARVTCTVCGRSFRLPLHLGRHMAATHGGGKKKVVRSARGRRTIRTAGGLDVSNLTVDQLLSLKTALDARLGDLVQSLRKAKVRV